MVTWCGRSNLQTNTSKTREMTIDFRKEKSPVTPLMIKVSPIEIVDSFTFLGTIISLGLDWEASISSILKKAQQRVYFLCRLERFGLRPSSVLQGSDRERAVLLAVSLVWQHHQKPEETS